MYDNDRTHWEAGSYPCESPWSHFGEGHHQEQENEPRGKLASHLQQE